MLKKYIADTPEGQFRDEILKEYLGKNVHIEIDRPIGYIHEKEKYSLHYNINYGYIPGVLGGDDEEFDVYLLGVSQPVKEYDCKIIGAIRRLDDCEDKLVACPVGSDFSKEDIAKLTHFQEQYYTTFVITSTDEIR